MGETTLISWADGTFNPWWGCVQVKGSQACGPGEGEAGADCYAMKLDARFYSKSKNTHWGADKKRLFVSDRYWKEPLKWDRDAKKTGVRRRNFCMSMGDWAEGRSDQREHLERLWKLIAQTGWTDWLMLTKRPQLIRSLYPEEWQRNPPPNVWMGTTAEDQHWLDSRWPFLREISRGRPLAKHRADVRAPRAAGRFPGSG